MKEKLILLVEDNTFDVKVFRQAVRDAGLENRIVVAVDGIEALKMLHMADDPDEFIVVADMSMPRMNGLELLRKIRSTPEFAALPVFIVSTSDYPNDEHQVLELGIEGYIQKNSNERDLVDPIIRFLGEWERQP